MTVWLGRADRRASPPLLMTLFVLAFANCRLHLVPSDAFGELTDLLPIYDKCMNFVGAHRG